MTTNTKSVRTEIDTSFSAPKPFLKWTGGKQWLGFVIGETLASHRRCHYIEPFLGGGAIFFALQPETALLSDSNADLIATYRAVRDSVDDVVEGLSKLRNHRSTFEKIRYSEPSRLVDRAVRFIYLNKTAFNGMYRVNKEGMFNVPYGLHPGATICQEDRLRSASLALASVALRTANFQSSLKEAKRGDLVYLDPPYVTTHNNNGFLKYNALLFSWNDQKKLATIAEELRKKGVVVIVSNAAHDSVMDLYPNFYVLELDRNSLIGGGKALRGSVTEALLCSFPLTI
jgi:DNA adenine methylase